VAAQIQPGRVYRGGEVLGDPSLGLQLTMPRGWSGRLAPDGESFRLQPDTGEAHLVVIADQMTDTIARARMAQPIDVGDGIVLRLTGEVRDVAAGHLSGNFTVGGTPSRLDGTIDVRLAQSGMGVVFILLTPPARTEAARQVMREFALSLGVTQQARTAGGAGGDAWEPWLRGLYLAHFFTRTGYTESTEIWLCSDGSFRINDQGGGFGGGASGAAVRSGTGRWSATGTGRTGQLVLDYGGGQRSTFELTYDYEQNRLFLNGERFLRGKNERCR
jgi:hypothetical protein